MKKLFALLFIILVFAACKRDAALPIPTNNAMQIFYPTNDTNVCAVFNLICDQNTSYANPLIHTVYHPSVDFSTTTVNHPNDVTAVDSLFFSNVLYPFDTTTKSYSYYFTYPFPIQVNNNTWRVVGAKDIPSFTFNQNPMPALDYSLIPDTIDHTKPLTLPVHITSSNNASININSSTTKYFNPQNTNSVYFSSGYLDSSAFGNQNYAYLYVNANNINSYNVFGKTMHFTCLYSFAKIVYFK